MSRAGSSDSAVELHQLWAVDGAAEGWELEAPRAVAIDPRSGRIAVADHLHHHVLVYSADGERRFRWPEDDERGAVLSVPAALAWDSAGRLRVLDNDHRRISVIDSAGKLIESVDMKSARFEAFEDLWLMGNELAGWSRLVPENADSARTGTVSILRTTKGGTSLEAILGAKVLLDASGREVATSVPGGGLPSIAVLSDSLVVVAGEIPELRFRVLNRTGAIAHQVCRVTSAYRPTPSGDRRSDEQEVPKFEGDTARVMRVLVGTDRRVWIQRTPGSVGLLQDRWFGPPGALFDLFGEEGDFLGTVHAPQDVRIVAASDRAVIGLREPPTGGVAVIGFGALRSPAGVRKGR